MDGPNRPREGGTLRKAQTSKSSMKALSLTQRKKSERIREKEHKEPEMH